MSSKKPPRPRIDRVTTGTGDDGLTSIGDDRLLSKASDLFELLGTLDEANSALGMIDMQADLPGLRDMQSRLFDIGAAVVTGHAPANCRRWVAELEDETTRLNAELPPLAEFILPGGGETAARCHLARTIARRAERCFWRCADELHPLVEAGVGVWLNRLSDYLFVAARTTATEERLWQPDNAPAAPEDD